MNTKRICSDFIIDEITFTKAIRKQKNQSTIWRRGNESVTLPFTGIVMPFSVTWTEKEKNQKRRRKRDDLQNRKEDKTSISDTQSDIFLTFTFSVF